RLERIWKRAKGVFITFAGLHRAFAVFDHPVAEHSRSPLSFHAIFYYEDSIVVERVRFQSRDHGAICSCDVNDNSIPVRWRYLDASLCSIWFRVLANEFLNSFEFRNLVFDFVDLEQSPFLLALMFLDLKEKAAPGNDHGLVSQRGKIQKLFEVNLL